MDILLTKNHLSFKDASLKKWYITSLAQKPVCKVKILFEDGKSLMYRSENRVNVNDVAVIGSGCKTSAAMGKVIDNTNTSGGKGRLAAAKYVFSTNPNTADIKKMVSEVFEVSGYNTVTKLFGGCVCRQEPATLAEKEIEKILFAINV